MNAPSASLTAEAVSILPCEPPGATAAALLRLSLAQGWTIVFADGEREADELAALLQAMAPSHEVLRFPAWDCLPYDRLRPSASVSGRRAAVLGRIASGIPKEALIVAGPESLVQRVPRAPATAWSTLTLALGAALNPDALAADLVALGYWPDDRVDEAGEFTARGATFDLYPAGSDNPMRLSLQEGRIAYLREFEPGSQRSLADRDSVTIVSCREIPCDKGEAAASWNGPWQLLAEALPAATLVLGAGALGKAIAFLATVAEATASLPPTGAGGRSYLAEGLYADAAALEASLLGRDVRTLTPIEGTAVPRFATQADPDASFRRFAAEEARAGLRLVVTAPTAAALRRAARMAARATGRKVHLGSDAREALEAPSTKRGASAIHGALLPATAGFRDRASGITVVTAQDLLGTLALVRTAPVPADSLEQDWSIGDAVVHLDHGICRLGGLERITDPDGQVREVIRLVFAGEEAMLLPVAEAGALWRYGSRATVARLDAMHGSTWQARREAVGAELAETSRALVAAARARRRRRAPVIEPPTAPFERFAARFPYTETPDQAQAIADVLEDLGAGHPMDRLVCGDVGFGKTEVALRAAAAVALSGLQVAVAAPTTILARQHAETFRRRFAGFGIGIAELSRFVPTAEAGAVRNGLVDGSIRIVIGTHAVAGPAVRFKELGLVVVDEEQRFGAAQKARLRALGKSVHVLTMTATPIPRTLQSALSGLRDLSRIATAPVARRHVRTMIEPFSPEGLAQALRRETARGGQSFVVCPRVEDLAPLAEILQVACPELTVITLHARLPARELDDALLAFADGKGDVLLATSIVEIGLDVPHANTMAIWHPDRFGLAQLHQLRGRVGRGRSSGFCVLLTDPAHPPGEGAMKRLKALAALDRPGAGFAISTRDLDLRGAGDLLGDEQSGHVGRIGAELTRHLAEKALHQARGEDVADEPGDVRLGDPGGIPENYVAGQEERLVLYLRLARATEPSDVVELTDEIEDRFGPPPAEARLLLATAALRTEAGRLGVERLDVGPKGVAANLRPRPAQRVAQALRRPRSLRGVALTFGENRLTWAKSGDEGTDAPRARLFLRGLRAILSKAPKL